MAKPVSPKTLLPKTTLPKAPAPRTLGPVSDLERHLPAEWWRTLFNSVYLKTDGDVVENERNTAEDVSLLMTALDLKPETRILDLCCGQGRHCLELARRGFRNVTGVDRSRYLIRLARRRARKCGLTINFREGDARKFRLPEQSLDCVVLFGNSFGYFEREEDDHAVLRSIQRVLISGGKIALDLVDGEWMRLHFDPRTWEWIDQNHFVCRERALANDGARLISREVVTHAERGVIADQFYAERLYTWEDIRALLEQAGFLKIEHHGAPATASDRNQDLGMMAHRMFITAEAPPKPSVVVGRGPVFPEVTVIMGDPRLPDTVKREGQFNSEDFATINILREALGKLEAYKFQYIDDHENLLGILSRKKPRFVFNLCDEGYQNDAFKELHVPALLDMLGIPYTGAGPASLGLCYNKSLVRAIAQSIDVAVPLETYCTPEDQAATLPSVFPALLKPCYGDSSIGITKEAVVQTMSDLMNYLENLRSTFPKRPILVQEFLGGNEYSVGIIGNPGLNVTALPILEVDYSELDAGLPQILGYESKWEPDSPYWTKIKYHQADLDEDTQRRLVDHSLLLFERLECRDYARFDFRADSKGRIKLLEVNPNPGWCWDGKFNYMAGFAGLEYADLLRMILEAAQERFASNV
ncbi:MAG: methyltransferase domain-containing protein [Candidatus Hydrogenedentes bacterium]|nr:methyltransferase domain-containing protein [Candidatus Hydrogenedentota bacterium]